MPSPLLGSIPGMTVSRMIYPGLDVWIMTTRLFCSWSTPRPSPAIRSPSPLVSSPLDGACKNVMKDIGANLKSIAGGELTTYTQLLTESRNQALQRMSADASARGANAIVNVRFATSSVANGASELFAYGTAVVIE